MFLDILLDAPCAVLLEETAGFLVLVHLQEIHIVLVERVHAVVALLVHFDTATVAVVVGLSARGDIAHEVAALAAPLALLETLLSVGYDLFAVSSPHVLLADTRHTVPPTLLMLAVPPIDHKSVVLSLGMRQHLQHMSLADIIRRSVIVKVVRLAFLDIHTQSSLVGMCKPSLASSPLMARISFFLSASRLSSS